MGSVPSECCSNTHSKCPACQKDATTELSFDSVARLEQAATEEDALGKLGTALDGRVTKQDACLVDDEATCETVADNGFKKVATRNEKSSLSARQNVDCVSHLEGKWQRQNGEVLGRIAKSRMTWAPPGPGVASAYEHEDSLLEPVGENTVSMYLEGATYEGKLVSQIDAEGQVAISILWSDGELWVKVPDDL